MPIVSSAIPRINYPGECNSILNRLRAKKQTSEPLDRILHSAGENATSIKIKWSQIILENHHPTMIITPDSKADVLNQYASYLKSNYGVLLAYEPGVAGLIRYRQNQFENWDGYDPGLKIYFLSHAPHLD